MQLNIGDVVEYVDERGEARPALVTCIFGSDSPSINVVFVSGDDAMEDTYGRQIARETSVVHESNQSAHGMFWRRP